MLSAEAPRKRRVVLLALGALSALVLLAACGDDEDGGDGGSDQGGATELEIAVDPDGEGKLEPLTATVECEGGETDDPVCAAVEELPDDPGAPTPPDVACTELYGGPDVLTVKGTLRGAPIDAEMTRGNGCEIERFERFTPLLAALFPDYQPGSELTPP